MIIVLIFITFLNAFTLDSSLYNAISFKRTCPNNLESRALMIIINVPLTNTASLFNNEESKKRVEELYTVFNRLYCNYVSKNTEHEFDQIFEKMLHEFILKSRSSIAMLQCTYHLECIKKINIILDANYYKAEIPTINRLHLISASNLKLIKAYIEKSVGATCIQDEDNKSFYTHALEHTISLLKKALQNNVYSEPFIAILKNQEAIHAFLKPGRLNEVELACLKEFAFLHMQYQKKLSVEKSNLLRIQH